VQRPDFTRSCAPPSHWAAGLPGCGLGLGWLPGCGLGLGFRRVPIERHRPPSQGLENPHINRSSWTFMRAYNFFTRVIARNLGDIR